MLLYKRRKLNRIKSVEQRGFGGPTTFIRRASNTSWCSYINDLVFYSCRRKLLIRRRTNSWVIWINYLVGRVRELIMRVTFRNRIRIVLINQTRFRKIKLKGWEVTKCITTMQINRLTTLLGLFCWT